MFQFRRFPSYTYVFSVWCMGLTPYGLLHSDICGSFRACQSPQLFAAYRVLLRLLMPRHPPCALISLTFSTALAVTQNYVWFILFSRTEPTEELKLYHPNKFGYLLIKIVFLFVVSLFNFQRTSSLIQHLKPPEHLLVGTNGLEPSTSRLSGVRSNHLSYAPFWYLLFSSLRIGGD